MDKYIDERFDRVQRALTALIDSITKYTPSTTQANELAQADKELSEGLHELQTHQNNYLRIQELRKEADDLDAQIKTTVSLLWNTRKEITATPTTSYPSSGPRYDFSYSDLLNYARRIARTTVPPPGVTNGVDLSAPPAEQGSSSAEQTPVTDNPLVTNGTTTTTTQPTASADPSQQTSQQTFTTALPEHMADSVNLLEGAVFYPWPGEDRIRNGALERCQRLVNAGVDPVGYDPEEEERKRQAAREEADRKEALEAEERRKREEERFARARAAALERESERERQAAVQAAGGGGEGAGAGAGAGQSGTEARRDSKPKQFQFMGGLDDEDDD